jgi:hypothetical protein
MTGSEETESVVNKPLKEKDTQVLYVQSGLDYVAVAGTSKPVWYHEDASAKGLAKMANNFITREEKFKLGERAQFINQGIRKLREYQGLVRKTQDRSFFLVCKETYSGKVLDIVDKIAKRYGATFGMIESGKDLADFVNNFPFAKPARVKKNKIRALDIFSHGLVGSIDFGYKTDKEQIYRFASVEAAMLHPEMFDSDSLITSYACRTGVGVDKESFKESDDKAYNKSLAQRLANATETYVYAYVRRSNYGITYGTDAQRVIANDKQVRKTIKNHDDETIKYKEEMRIYENKMRQYKEDSKYNASIKPDQVVKARILGEPPKKPQEPQKNFSDEDRKLVDHAISQETNQNLCGIPLDVYGAIGPVKAGSTPTGLPDGLRKFSPVI